MDRMSSPGTIDDFATVQPVVVLATCLAVLDSAREDAYGQAGLESGDGLLADALTNRDVKTRLAAWDDPTIEWDAIVACVLRSTWDYPERLNEFTRWMDAVSEKTLLLNDADLVRWNIHKRYLIDLERAGIPVVPTVHVERGGVLDLPRLQGGLGSDGLVIKPAVGAGSFGVTRVSPDDPESIAVAGSLVRAGDVIVQPYVPSIETEGETSTILVAGTISHAVVKTPAPGEYRVQPHHGGTKRFSGGGHGPERPMGSTGAGLAREADVRTHRYSDHRWEAARDGTRTNRAITVPATRAQSCRSLGRCNSSAHRSSPQVGVTRIRSSRLAVSDVLGTG
jgi:Prokaryotic glutathione synthetase, ATP-grasp domain